MFLFNVLFLKNNIRQYTVYTALCKPVFAMKRPVVISGGSLMPNGQIQLFVYDLVLSLSCFLQTWICGWWCLYLYNGTLLIVGSIYFNRFIIHLYAAMHMIHQYFWSIFQKVKDCKS